MNKLAIILLLFIGKGVFAQDTIRVQWADTTYSYLLFSENGSVIDTTWLLKPELKDAFYKRFGENTVLAEQGLIEDGEKQGQWAYWGANGALRMTENHLNGKLHGSRKVYWDEGSLRENFNYINGVEVGFQMKFDYAGKMWYKKKIDEKGNGTFWEWKKTIVQTGNLKNWQKDGVWKMKSTVNGHLIKEEYYVKGKLSRKP